jgi:aminopeptidase N
MTDQITSFTLLVNCPIDGQAEEAINQFYKQWSHDPLVLDKWFALQASSELPGTLTRVKALLEHPAFSFKNPNKVRAVVGAFIQNNPRYFHQLSGAGYAFLSDMLIQMDKINPQIAARLATPFSRGDRFDDQRRQLIQEQLERLIKEKLSKDLFEVVSKSIETVN